MKDYKRLTEKDYVSLGETGFVCEAEHCLIMDCKNCEAQINYNRLHDLEDKIESGELCDREEVKKETAKEIFNKLKKRKSLNYEEKTGLSWEYVDFNDIIKIIKKYGVDLEEQK